jgi:phospholipase C
MALTDIETVVLVMMENRSFDHVLGHLRFDNLIPSVEGLKPPRKQEAYENLFENGVYYPWKDEDRPLAFDPPHEWDAVATQLAKSGQHYRMSGFVKAYYDAKRQAAIDAGQTKADAKKIVPGPNVECMSFLDAHEVPMSSFLAQNFAVCHHWFASLPTSTQPNRTMAWCGDTPIADTKTRTIPSPTTILDWLDNARVRWRVYHDGLSFFALYPIAWHHVLGNNFRGFEHLLSDFVSEPNNTFPQVLIVEPSYASAPHIGSDRPNDNHPPVSMGFGEEFLRDVYDAVTANPARWAETVMIITYDEHGGFFDHVEPPQIPYTVRNSGQVVREFKSLGIRVPAIVVSPFAPLGGVIDATMDHTSVLQLLAERFTPGQPYSASVEQRRQAGIASASAALTLPAPRTVVPKSPMFAIPAATTLDTRGAVRDDMQGAFEKAALDLMQSNRPAVAQKMPELIHWEVAIAQAPGRTPIA